MSDTRKERPQGGARNLSQPVSGVETDDKAPERTAIEASAPMRSSDKPVTSGPDDDEEAVETKAVLVQSSGGYEPSTGGWYNLRAGEVLTLPVSIADAMIEDGVAIVPVVDEPTEDEEASPS